MIQMCTTQIITNIIVCDAIAPKNENLKHNECIMNYGSDNSYTNQNRNTRFTRKVMDLLAQ